MTGSLNKDRFTGTIFSSNENTSSDFKKTNNNKIAISLKSSMSRQEKQESLTDEKSNNDVNCSSCRTFIDRRAALMNKSSKLMTVCSVNDQKATVKSVNAYLQQVIRFWSTDSIKKLDSTDFISYIDLHLGHNVQFLLQGIDVNIYCFFSFNY